jgi:PKD repeat protein
MKRQLRLSLFFSLLIITLIFSNVVNAEIKYKITGTVYYKDQTGATGIKIEIIENESVIKSTKTDGSGNYKADVELYENQEYSIRLSKDKVQTQLHSFITPDSTQNTITLNFTLNRNPKADSNGEYDGYIQEPISFSSEGSNDQDTDPLSYLWIFGDGDQSIEPNPVHVYNAPGEYQVTLTVTDIDGASDTDSTKCTLQNKPPIIILNGPYSVKEGEQITFNTTGTHDPDGEIVSYLWDFDDGTKSTQTQPTHTYSEKGDYTIELLVTDNYEAETKVTVKCTVSENKPPTSNANGPYTSNAEEEIYFTSTGTIDPDDTELYYLWDFGDGTTSISPDPIHSYLEEGTYSVTLIVSDPSGSSDTDTTTSTIAPPLPKPPIAETNGPYNGYKNKPIQFSSKNSNDPDGEIVEYLWDFGDGQYSKDQSPVHIYNTVNEYNVTLTVTDNSGEVDIDTTQCTIKESPPPPLPVIYNTNTPPTANGNGPYTGETYEMIYFSSQNSYDSDGVITAYYWIFGDEETSSEPNPTHTYEASGLYNITLKVTDNEGKKDEYHTTCNIIKNNQDPIPEINVKTTSKINEEIIFNSSNSHDPDGEIEYYHWEFGDGGISNEPNPTYSYLNPGNYSITLTINDEKGAVNSAQVSIDIKPNTPPYSIIEGPKTAEVGQLVTFTGEKSHDIDGKIVEYLFDLGDNKFSPSIQTSYMYQKPGTYAVTLTVIDDSQAENVSIHEIMIYQNNPPMVVGEKIYKGVQGEEIYFEVFVSDPDGKISNIEWNFGDGKTSSKINPVHAYDAPGEYMISIIATDNQGKETEMSTIAIILPRQTTRFPVYTTLVVIAICALYYFRKDSFV